MQPNVSFSMKLLRRQHLLVLALESSASRIFPPWPTDLCAYNMMHIFQSPRAPVGLERNLCILMGLIKFQPPLPTSVGTVRERERCGCVRSESLFIRSSKVLAASDILCFIVICKGVDASFNKERGDVRTRPAGGSRVRASAAADGISFPVAGREPQWVKRCDSWAAALRRSSGETRAV